MNEEMNFETTNKKLNKNSFILMSISLSLVCAIIVSVFVVQNLQSLICGFIPAGFVAFCCAVGQIVGTVYYIKKHKYAHGESYEWYQVINASIYGIQNVLRVLLVVLLVNICTLPIVGILLVIYGIRTIRKIFK